MSLTEPMRTWTRRRRPVEPARARDGGPGRDGIGESPGEPALVAALRRAFPVGRLPRVGPALARLLLTGELPVDEAAAAPRRRTRRARFAARIAAGGILPVSVILETAALGTAAALAATGALPSVPSIVERVVVGEHTPAPPGSAPVGTRTVAPAGATGAGPGNAVVVPPEFATGPTANETSGPPARGGVSADAGGVPAAATDGTSAGNGKADANGNGVWNGNGLGNGPGNGNGGGSANAGDNGSSNSNAGGNGRAVGAGHGVGG